MPGNYLLTKASANSEDSQELITEDRIREEVIKAVAWGLEPASIAALMGLPLKDLEAEYAHELEHGANILLANCAGRVYDIAMNSKDPRAALPALLAILKFKGNWKDTHKDSGAGGNTTHIQAVQFVLPAQMKTEDWQAAADVFRTRLEKEDFLEATAVEPLDKP